MIPEEYEEETKQLYNDVIKLIAGKSEGMTIYILSILLGQSIAMSEEIKKSKNIAEILIQNGIDGYKECEKQNKWDDGK